jgi:hypothetical protein
VDVRVEVVVDGAVASTRDINDVSAGGPGFNNAILRTLRLPGVTSPTTGQTDFRVSVRRTCFGSGHASGGVRLWYNGPAVDSGATRGAGSLFQSPVDETGITYYLRTGGTLSQTAGPAAAYKDVQVTSAEACSPSSPTTRAFTPFQTWSLALP